MHESNILDIGSNFVTDSKITKIEYHPYDPYTRSYNNNDEIRITVQQKDVYPFPYKNVLFIQEKVEDVAKVKFCKNGLAFFLNKFGWK